MSNYAEFLQRRRHRHLLIVEGNHEKNKLMNLILKCFPEIDMQMDDIVIYETNIYLLYNDLNKMYPEGWWEQDVDLPLLVSEKKGIEPRLEKQDFTTIILLFDYERHDPNYSEEKIMQMQAYFQDETEAGKLYLNYPMVESYQHLNKIPDDDYEYTMAPATIESGKEYKSVVRNTFVAKLVRLPMKLQEILTEKYGVDEAMCESCVDSLLMICKEETMLEEIDNILSGIITQEYIRTARYQMRATLMEREYIKRGYTYYEYMRWLLIQIIIHNIKKANKVQNNEYGISNEELESVFSSLKLEKVLEKQNEVSKDIENGFIWVLNTSVFLVPEYNFSLLRS